MMDLHHLYKKLIGREPTILGMDHFAKFAVLLPLVKKNNEIHILFEVRSFQMRRQPGEVCFPGGKVDHTDQNELYTAVRETSEELGIPESKITNIYPLDYMVTPFGTIIYPFVGQLNDLSELKLNEAEVAEIFTVPLSFFQKAGPQIYKINFQIKPEKGFPYDQIVGGERYNWQARKMEEHFYFYEDRVIWGMTARILSHFVALISK